MAWNCFPAAVDRTSLAVLSPHMAWSCLPAAFDRTSLTKPAALQVPEMGESRGVSAGLHRGWRPPVHLLSDAHHSLCCWQDRSLAGGCGPLLWVGSPRIAYCCEWAPCLQEK